MRVATSSSTRRLGSAAAWPLAARAQQGDRVRRVGALIGAAKDNPRIQSIVATFRERLAMLGWVEGGNLRMDYRFTGDFDRLAAYAEELVTLRPELIFAVPGPAARAVQQRTPDIPIVFVGNGDPASSGLISNIARPGGNTTGFANIFYSLGGKWLELFKEAVPHLTRVADLFSANGPNANLSELRANMAAAATRLGITIVRMPVGDVAAIEPAITAFAATPDGGLLFTGAAPSAYSEAIERLALHYSLPLMRGSGAAIGRAS
jgi:putative ABC transport system substrate-binding protein